ncbi:SAM-dependent methyltransferase [Treponema phagedenis]|uniref:NOL1/NOP2/Sun domain family member 4 n=1 Tax=Treponema phagedenis TaxID=162 RepID=A0A0B7GW55_TREPH|nr:SAM-dependent methyltransferase [Treponema phagedenis]NVP22844.1 SAM-dependent methyltransferase [Treponema phagedenis]QKS92205.1 SAM-dependent methyltransferase [Treponema phagedenis]QLC57745.1 SAM-dependent methyltransferase [Treponema phagedenis]QSH99443.1 SAM-dependent methyltransferase [Treponema phagedenis]CEM61787.1 NOL1/NOP2/sun family protein [Treponema phagedenis]
MKKKETGAKAFEAYYRDLFGARWEPLRKALLEESKQIAFSDGLRKPYYLDFASVQAARALPYSASGHCLDMCAAPGGKTLVLLRDVLGKDALLHANELSLARRRRLQEVIKTHLPPEENARVQISGFDAARMPRFKRNAYERILLDAPCSSERHLLRDQKYLTQWTESRVKSLSRRQWALISAAFLLLKPDGFLVYSTCALAPQENDMIIDKLIKKYGSEVIVEKISQDKLCEPTQFGIQYLPDTAEGAGPIYIARIKKSAKPALNS